MIHEVLSMPENTKWRLHSSHYSRFAHVFMESQGEPMMLLERRHLDAARARHHPVDCECFSCRLKRLEVA